MKVLLSILIIGLLLFSACGTLNSERQEIITFTRQALEIEDERNELMAYFASFPLERYGTVQGWLVRRFLLEGVPTNLPATYNAPRSGLEGMASLRQRILLLDCPQSMQPIKDALVYIYNSEVELAEHDLAGPIINQDNLELWHEDLSLNINFYISMDDPWLKLQLMRRDVYIRLAEILQEHGIDPAQEGFTELVGQG